MVSLRVSRAVLAILSLSVAAARAATYSAISLEQQAAMAGGVFRGTAISGATGKGADGHIYTETIFRVNEAMKGRFGQTVSLVHRGGKFNRQIENFSASPTFRIGEEYLLFVSQGKDGRLTATCGAQSAIRLGAGEASSQAQPTPPASLPGLLPNNPRLPQADRDEPIGYIVDTEHLPAGLTQAQALTAIQNAFAAWAAVTSCKFQFEGFQNFGTSVFKNWHDGKIRIQTHATYDGCGSTPMGCTDGESDALAAVGDGGIFSNTEFITTASANIIIQDFQPEMSVPKKFEQTICHEIGHALGLAHSSENPNEADPDRKEAMMYYLFHNDLRGATLGIYDPPIAGPVYPVGNRPPYVPHRYIRCVTTSVPATTPGENEVELRFFDLNTPAAQLTVTQVGIQQNQGTFSRNGLKVKYTPSVFPGPSGSFEPSDDNFFNYDYVIYEISDGTMSTIAQVALLSYSPDNFPAGAGDGIPDNWMVQYFGNSNPAAGARRSASSDFDGDGRTNLQEYREGTSPVNPLSAFRANSFDKTMISWTTRPYEVYQLQSSTDLVNWTKIAAPIQPVGGSALRSIPVDASLKKYYSVEKPQ